MTYSISYEGMMYRNLGLVQNRKLGLMNSIQAWFLSFVGWMPGGHGQNFQAANQICIVEMYVGCMTDAVCSTSKSGY